MRTIKGLFGWLTKNWEEISDIFAWANVRKELTDEEVGRIQEYFLKKKDYRLVIIINGVNSLRPQRTWGSLPEWFRNDTAYHDIYHAENAFVIAATNLDKNLDPAFLRRFDKTINFDIYTNNLRSLIALKYFLEYDKEKKYDIIEFKNYFDELFSSNIGALSPANIKNAIKAAFAFIEDDASVEDMKSLISQELHERAEPC